MSLGARVDEIDVLMEKFTNLVERCTPDDPDLGAGEGTTQGLDVVQRHIDRALASCEALDDHARKVIRGAA